MSALPPIATANADSRKGSCLLYPQKRTCAVHTPMSALGQKRTHAAQQKGPLFDHLVGAGDERGRHGETKRFRSLEVDDQLQLGREFHRKITRVGSFQDFVHIGGGTMKVLGKIDAIADETARIDMIPKPVDGWYLYCRCY